MTHSPESPNPQPLSQAAVHILIAIGTDERHGYAIMSDIATITGGAVRMGPGTLYTTIKRLLAEGLIEESGERPDPALQLTQWAALRRVLREPGPIRQSLGFPC